ncbi:MULTISPECIES: helix-turn-helix transcriptional regulator [Rhizobiaceae]|jgi:transcriptional regulator with XRE-family HTH domain|uniref:Transcriptional regulator with XRE-family HTH domain n=1 Tax=Aliirhizobium cellulosilyticum TaxID=393664 RepID=A0A7W6Y264_9HYPH|nr:helix-turn-helix transcriptional regulator [Rhizobium cellulosilyticum]MBB4347864.1 transcriptional regulator with XRE-family HTH domain [Rhizobium cellulosilyticum]MBB4409742.1 transcriptional regulator with XRE-family HTH domain [Rhizobium cellulosilyticum]MBB4444429.1 transcriptional regulator with XRE-family HTH domain [Rhizobium cellulosilyticum]
MAEAIDKARDDNPLGSYLKDRRAKLDPAEFGIEATRRRTPGLRREEVAQRANVSATWYTWLEQGRGGSPSSDVLDRLAKALALTSAEREHLFLLAQHRPPEIRHQPFEPISAQLQRVLDAMTFSPAVLRTALWDVVGWNAAASVVMTDYALLPPEERNILKLIFCNQRVRGHMVNWERDARSAVASFRAEAIKAAPAQALQAMVEELSQASPEFSAIWQNYDIQNYGAGTKHFRHEIAGDLMMEYSSFTVDGRPDLGLVVFTPMTEADAERVRQLLKTARNDR